MGGIKQIMVQYNASDLLQLIVQPESSEYDRLGTLYHSEQGSLIRQSSEVLLTRSWETQQPSKIAGPLENKKKKRSDVLIAKAQAPQSHQMF